jgi:hypothetical protein
MNSYSFVWLHTILRAFPAMIFILAIQKTTFSILATNFSLQVPTVHSLLFLNIIF